MEQDNPNAVADFNVVDTTPDQPAVVETPAPATAPEATAPTSPATTPAVPLDVLNQLVRQELGDSYTVNSAEDVAKILGAKHKEMREKQELAAQAATRLRKYEPFVNRMEQDKAYERRVLGTSLEYADQLTGQREEETPSGIPSPLVGEVLSLKQWKEQQEAIAAEQFVVNSIEALSKDPDYGAFVTPDMKREVALECAATGNFDPEAVFLKKYGRQILGGAKSQARKEHAAQIQATNAAAGGLGVPTAALPVSQPVTDPRTMSKEEADKWADAELRRIATDPKYAAEKAKEFIEQSGGVG